jgi:7-cyano-7-deazaguanine synthase in queuosine biosynthesis
MKTLLLFSGGKDSTYVLYKLLTETDDEVTAIQLYKKNDTKMAIIGSEDSYMRVPALLTELKKIRDFNFIKKEISPEDITQDTSHYYTFFVNYATPFLNDGTYDRIATGRTWEQQDQKFFKNSDVRSSPSQIAGQRMFEENVQFGTLWNPLISHDFVQNYSRYHALSLLPNNISPLTFSCDDPIVTDGTIEECGICYKCLWDQKILELVDEGYTADQISEWRRLKSSFYGDANKSAPMKICLHVEMNKGFILRALDSKEKIREFVRKTSHYSFNGKNPNSGIWDFSDLE